MWRICVMIMLRLWPPFSELDLEIDPLVTLLHLLIFRLNFTDRKIFESSLFFGAYFPTLFLRLQKDGLSPLAFLTGRPRTRLHGLLILGKSTGFEIDLFFSSLFPLPPSLLSHLSFSLHSGFSLLSPLLCLLRSGTYVIGNCENNVGQRDDNILINEILYQK